MDSSTYILIFPTGLLLQVGISPLQIQGQMDLKSKKDETIVDFSYCLSDDGKQHCVWMLDEKCQVWKCSSELNPNSCNWTSTKVAMADHLLFWSFLKPAMTFDDYFFSTGLNKLRCFRSWVDSESHKYTHQAIFNFTATRVGILKQPRLSQSSREDPRRTKLTLEQALQKNLNSSVAQFDRRKVRMMLVAKRQHILLNKIPERQSVISLLKRGLAQRVATEAQDFR